VQCKCSRVLCSVDTRPFLTLTGDGEEGSDSLDTKGVVTRRRGLCLGRQQSPGAGRAKNDSQSYSEMATPASQLPKASHKPPLPSHAGHPTERLGLGTELTHWTCACVCVCV
jgi:hypothetical protein